MMKVLKFENTLIKKNIDHLIRDVEFYRKTISEKFEVFLKSNQVTIYARKSL